MDLTQVPWGDLGSPALVAIFVLGVLRGDVVPRKVHEAMLQQEQRNTERLTAVLQEVGPAVEKMAAELAHTTEAILTARKGG